MYCGSDTTWATVDDLYDRFGDEFVDKLAIRRVWDEGLQSYVADESPEGKLKVIELALCDAKGMILTKLQCLYSNVSLIEDAYFPSIKVWHMKMTIETLKVGGDCYKCNCEDLDKFLSCNNICSDDGVCLISKSTFISVSPAVLCCEMMGKGCCCSGN